MKRMGIVCEYNPLHTGHAYLLREAKAAGDAVVCVMSGNFTQRGEMAILDKYARAEAAIAAGADLVLELPFPQAMSSAPFFARGGVSILASVGVTHLCFGSESGDLTRLWRASEAKVDVPLASVGAAKGYFDALGDAALSSNDILGASYLCAIREGGYAMEPMAIRREGDGYREETLGASAYASATAIRQAILGGDADAALPFMPAAMRDIFERERQQGCAPACLAAVERAILWFWRTAERGALAGLAELGGGLAERLADAAKNATSLAQMYALAATKKYTDAHIRRAVLYGMMGVRWEDLERVPAFTYLLAANKTGCDILASLRKEEAAIPILTKPADAAALAARYPVREGEILRAVRLAEMADALYTLALPTPAEGGYFTRRRPFIATGVDE